MTIARGSLTLDFKPDGAHEDVLSETVAMTTTTSATSCPGRGIGTTFCEIGNGSTDAFLPRTPALAHEAAPGGRISGLTMIRGAGSDVTLNWLPSCSTGDTNYEVYEGSIGSWYSHVPVTCATGGTSSTFAAAAGNRYYLVVPTNGTGEGSYGKNSASVERPVGSTVCVPQALGTCP
jgi:hypothetical protein